MGTNVTDATINDRTKKRLQIAFRRLMLGDSPSAEMKEYTGLDSFQLKQHISSKMLPGMTWNNYGEEWVVEHVVALCYFDLDKKEERKLAWNPINLMPIFKEDMRFKEGNPHFAKELLEVMAPSDAKDALLLIVSETLKIFDKYEKAYLSGKYYNPMK